MFTRTALQRVSGTDEIGSVRYYEGVTIGTDPAEVAAQSFTNEGMALEPWAPALKNTSSGRTSSSSSGRRQASRRR